MMRLLLQSGIVLLILTHLSLIITSTRAQCPATESPKTRADKLRKIHELEYKNDNPSWQFKSEKVCTTDACLDAALELITWMNGSVDPCEDFYEFACGNGIQMLRSQGDVDRFETESEKAHQSIWNILLTSNKAPKPLRDARTFYSQCLDALLSEKVGTKPLLQLSAQLGGWPLFDKDSWKPETFSVARALGSFRRIYSLGAILSVTVAPDPQKPTVNRIHLDQATWGPPRGGVLNLKNDEKTAKEYRQFFMDIMAELSKDLGKPAQSLDDLYESHLEFEIRMAKAWESAGGTDDQVEQTTIKKLQREIDSMWSSTHQMNDFSVLEFLQEIFATSGVEIDENEMLIVSRPKRLRELLKVLMSTPKSTIANYVAWRQTVYLMAMLNLKMRNIRNPESLLRSEPMCFELTMATYWPAVTRRYLQSSGGIKGRKQVQLINKHFVKTLDEFQRQSVGTIYQHGSDNTPEVQNQRVMKKLEDMKKVIGFPDWILNRTLVEEEYANVNLQLGKDLPTSYANMINWHSDRQLRKLRPELSQRDPRIDYTESLSKWTVSTAGFSRTHPYPVETQINFIPSEETIVLPAGVLRPPFFHPDWPKYMNYGRLGFLLGLANMRARDFYRDQIVFGGRDMDKTIFQAYTGQCFVEQYNNFEPLPGLHINGVRTLADNLVDEGAMYQAIISYILRYLKEGGFKEPEETLPGLERLTGTGHLFFLGFANLMCQTDSPEIIRNQVENDQVPAKYRVNGILQNLEEFGVFFGCPAGSNMNRGEQRCRTA